MDFGKYVWKIAAGVLLLVIAGTLLWRVFTGMKENAYEKEGTLVQAEAGNMVREKERLNKELEMFENVEDRPAFVRDRKVKLPEGEERIRRSEGV